MIEPSAQIEAVLRVAALQDSTADMMRATMLRESEFANPLEAKLTGIGLDPAGRELAEETLDDFWLSESRAQSLLNSRSVPREIIIGGGFHAAVYAAIRVLSGYPKPLVLERDERVGGAFAVTSQPTFHLNSRNRPGLAGLAGDLSASLNYLPGAPVQAANLSTMEYQTNADMAFVIRLTLAQYADVVPNTQVLAVYPDEPGVQIELDGGDILQTGRVIDARGLGNPSPSTANSPAIVTFTQFMRRMTGMWPLRGLRRVAVVGGGDSGKCAVESLLGIAPLVRTAAAALDRVEAIDWYASDLPSSCEQWLQQVRGRYQAIGRYLRPDRIGVRRLNILPRRVHPLALPGVGLIGGRTYDLIVYCAGYQETDIDGLEIEDFEEYPPSPEPVATKHRRLPVFRVGPHAQLPFTNRESADGITGIAANRVSMFRTSSKTAALAANLRSLLSR